MESKRRAATAWSCRMLKSQGRDKVSLHSKARKRFRLIKGEPVACALVPEAFHKTSLVRPGMVRVTWQKGGGGMEDT